jgi:hypothetical protein
VPLVAWVYSRYGDFQPLYAFLAALAALIFAFALAFPGERATRLATA